MSIWQPPLHHFSLVYSVLCMGIQHSWSVFQLWSLYGEVNSCIISKKTDVNTVMKCHQADRWCRWGRGLVLGPIPVGHLMLQGPTLVSSQQPPFENEHQERCESSQAHCLVLHSFAISKSVLKDWLYRMLSKSLTKSGPSFQSVVSLTSSLRVISLTVLVDSIHNILIFFAEKMWVVFATNFSKNFSIFAYHWM